MKKYILIAGVNGAGKSTLYQTLQFLKNMPRINTDEIVKEFGDWRNFSDVVKAGKIAIQKMNEYFKDGISFNQETTLCGNSILRNIEKAKQNNYFIEMHYVGVNSVDIAKERIKYRVQHGGHGIPDSDVERRYKESFKNLEYVIPKCDRIIMYDNTEVFERFSVYENGELVELTSNPPDWYNKLNHLS